MLQADVIFRLFPGETDIPCFTNAKNCGKLLMDYTLYFDPKFVESKNTKQNGI